MIKDSLYQISDYVSKYHKNQPISEPSIASACSGMKRAVKNSIENCLASEKEFLCMKTMVYDYEQKHCLYQEQYDLIKTKQRMIYKELIQFDQKVGSQLVPANIKDNLNMDKFNNLNQKLWDNFFPLIDLQIFCSSQYKSQQSVSQKGLKFLIENSVQLQTILLI